MREQRRIARTLGCGLAVAAFLMPGLLLASDPGLTAVEGKLITTRGDCPIVEVNGHNEPLSANNPHLFHTLQDKRLDRRQVRLEGVTKPDGSFEVHWLYTKKDGKLFKVRYFCATCNIVALEPGNCVCCQQPTELQEVPADKSAP